MKYDSPKKDVCCDLIKGLPNLFVVVHMYVIIFFLALLMVFLKFVLPSMMLLKRIF